MKKCGKILTGLFVLASVLFAAGCKPAADEKIKIHYESEYAAENLPEDKSVDYGYMLTAEDLPELTDEKFNFNGWYIGEEKASVETEVTEDITLKANWTEKPAQADPNGNPGANPQGEPNANPQGEPNSDPQGEPNQQDPNNSNQDPQGEPNTPPQPVTGTFEVSLTVPNQALCNYAEFTVKQNGTALTDYIGIPCTISDLTDNKVKAVAKSAEGKELAGGTYTIVFNVYTDENKFIETANYEDSIQIENGANTTKDYSKETTIVDEANVQTGTIGETGTNTYFIINKKMFIGGTGDLNLTEAESSYVSSQCKPVFEDIEDVCIGNGITLIGKKLFAYSEIKTVSGCINVTKIDSSAFEACTKLTAIPVFNNVTEIGSYAFSECSSLTNIGKIKKTETDVEVEAFPKAIEIGWNTFNECTGLKEVNGFNKVTTTGINLFIDLTALEEVKGFDALSTIKGNAFYGCTNLKKIEGFTNVTKICDKAFQDCTSLEELPAFANVTELCNCAFQDCTGLKYVGKIKYSENDVEVSVFDKVTTIGGMVFHNCNAIEEINGFNALTGSAFPSGIKTGSGSKLKYVKGFNSLSEIPANVFESNKALKSIAGFTNVTTIGKEAFRSCNALTEIPAFENVTAIVDYAFMNCYGLKEINGFNSVTTIGAFAFSSCTALESVSGFASLTNIEQKAFNDCTNLNSFDFASNSYEIGSAAFRNCTGFTEIVIPYAVKAIGYDAFCFNKASSITVLNPTIIINSDANNVFASGYVIDGGEKVESFAGTFNFAGSLEDWKKVLGWNGTDTDWNDIVDENGNYKQALSRIGLDKNITINFNYNPTSSN